MVLVGGRVVYTWLQVISATPWEWRETLSRALRHASAPYSLCFGALSHAVHNDVLGVGARSGHLGLLFKRASDG